MFSLCHLNCQFLLAQSLILLRQASEKSSKMSVYGAKKKCNCQPDEPDSLYKISKQTCVTKFVTQKDLFLKNRFSYIIPEAVQTTWIMERSGVYVTVDSSNIFTTYYLVNQNMCCI